MAGFFVEETNLATDYTEDVVTELGGALLSTSGIGALLPTNINWDCKIGGLPFVFAISDQNPLVRETAQFRRERVDNQREPGEQSLDSGYWIRSQSSWHLGSGLTSAEPLEINDAEARFRYAQGGGVDPWVPGQLSLLHSTEQVSVATGASQLLLGVNTGVLHAYGTSVKYVASSGGSATVSWGGSAPVQSLTSTGDNWIVTDKDGIWKGTVPSGTGSKIYNTGGTRTLARWVKSRLMVAVDNAVYEVTNLSPSGPTLPTVLFTNPSSSWVWTDFTAGPSAIYACGYDGDLSAIFKIDTTVTASTVTLSQPVVVAEMPRGESVLSMYAYVGSLLILGTSKGVRVASISAGVNDSGNLSVGPLLVETSDGSLDAVASGSYAYVTVGSKGEAGDRAQRAGLYRIDLGRNLNGNPLLFPVAADLVSPAGTSGACHQVTVAGGKLWFSVEEAGVFKETDSFVTSGWLETGRIRLGTIEGKAWRDMRLIAGAGTGTVTGFASLSDTTAPSTWNQVVSVNGTDNDLSGALNVVAPNPQANLYAGFKLAGDGTASPTFVGYQVRAIPAPRRSELIQVPVLLYDFELDRRGARFGNIGNAYGRYELLKQLERSSSTTLFRDFTTGEVVEVYIEQIRLRRTTPPTRNTSSQGGIATVTMRIVS